MISGSSRSTTLDYSSATSLGLSTGAFYVTIAMSDAAYAVGTVLAVQLAAHLPARRMLLVYVSVFVLAAVLCAWVAHSTFW